MCFSLQKKENYGGLKGIISARHHTPTWWVACDFSHIYSLRIFLMRHAIVTHPCFSYPEACEYTVSEIWHVADVVFVFYFGLFVTLLPLNCPKNQNFKKKKKNARRYQQFLNMYQKLGSDDVHFLRYAVRKMDRQTDGKSDI